ncbi:MAG: hypothetical protein EA392_00005, partial [Cryomorphaceae bacterium]
MMNWRQIDRLRVSHIRKAQRLLNTMLRDIRADLKRSLANTDSATEIETIVNNFTFDEQKVWDAWYKIYQDTGMAFAEKHYRHLKGSEKNYAKKDINDTLRRSVWLQKLLQYVDTECGDLIQNTTRAMFSGIQSNAQKAIRAGAENGWGAQRITDEIISLQGQMDN